VRHTRSLHFALGAVLLIAGTRVHGIVGATLAFAAAVVVIDGLVPPPGVTLREADERFCRLVRHRRRHRLARRLTLRAPSELTLLDEGAFRDRHSLGVQPVPIDSVTGTVEPGKTRDFDGDFRPSMPAREHWKRVWVAEGLPPIAVYRVGGDHYVIDGHHRVSTARDHGADTIEAEVTELGPAQAR
jgi:hypothetical protein